MTAVTGDAFQDDDRMPVPATTAQRRILRRLARTAGVSDVYEAAGTTRHPPDATLQAVLTALGHPCADEAAAARSLRALRRRDWTRPVQPVAVVWQDGGAAPTVTLSAPTDVDPAVTLACEDGTVRSLAPPVWGGVADTAAGRRRRGAVPLPPDLPPGYHRLTVAALDDEAICTVIAAPPRAPEVAVGRRWGWMLQAYAVRSADSRGQGEFPDLGALAAWSAGDGADFLLINPVHAAAPVQPREPSPYSPTSRRFADPCYLRVADVDGGGPSADDPSGALAADAPRIDRDAVWRAKRGALWEIYGRLGDAQRRDLAAYRDAGGQSLQRFATFCALAEHHGVPFTAWPEALQDPRAEVVATWATDNDELVGFHAWLQQQCGRQLRDAQDRARDAGMDIGIVHDLAVGVAPGGADVWSLPDEFARTMHVGAPPDAFNARGQDWGQPPPLPDAMRAAGYATQRQVVSASLGVGGGLRIDHILGFSRLFWIPDGAEPADGTYVTYPADELFAVLVLEAHRAGAIVIGEDLGTVDDRIRALMRHRGIAGSAVLWFEVDPSAPHGRRRAADYPPSALASVTTHDLPTATGWWDGSSLRRRDDLGLLASPLADAERRQADDHAAMDALLREHGVMPEGDPDVRAKVVALHRFLAMTPSALVAAALWDGVGDPREPNVPGTVDTYPNWRLPLASPGVDGPVPLTLEALTAGDAVGDVVAAIRAARG